MRRQPMSEARQQIAALKRLIADREFKAAAGLIDTDDKFYDYLDRCKCQLKMLKKRKS